MSAPERVLRLERLSVFEAVERLMDAHLLDCEFHGQDWTAECETCEWWGPVHHTLHMLGRESS